MILLALIALYVPLAGAGPSLQRAAVMGAAGLVALAVSRPASASYALLLAAAVTLAANPRVAGDAGWQLSFAAVAGIVAARPLAPRGPIAGAMWLTAVATVATTPLLALHFEAVPLASIPANLAALPAVAPVMWAGMLQTATGQLAALGAPGEAVAAAAGSMVALLAEPLLGVAGARRRPLRGAAPCGRGGQPARSGRGRSGLRRARRLRLSPPLGSGAAPRRTSTRPARGRGSRRGGRSRPAGLALLAAIVLAAGPVAIPAPPGRLTVSFLDVGQGTRP